ncbi:hypothetical protein QUB13_03290 [Microcoleus sp. B4-D4]
MGATRGNDDRSDIRLLPLSGSLGATRGNDDRADRPTNPEMLFQLHRYSSKHSIIYAVTPKSE